MRRTERASQQLKDRVEAQVGNPLAWMEHSLSDHELFAGDFTAAEIQMNYPVEFLAARSGSIDATPHLQAWLERFRGCPT